MDLRSVAAYVPLSDTLATAGQPTEAQLAAIAAAGFQVVINLALHDDPSYSLKDEAATVTALGMQYVHLPVEFSSPRLDTLTAFSNAMDAAAGHKVLVHCRHNKRVPVFIALHRILRQGWPEDLAFATMRAVWQPDARWQRFIDEALGAGPRCTATDR